MQMNGSEMEKDGRSESAHQGWMLASSEFTWHLDFDLKHQRRFKMMSSGAYIRILLWSMQCKVQQRTAYLGNKNRLLEWKKKTQAFDQK